MLSTFESMPIVWFKHASEEMARRTFETRQSRATLRNRAAWGPGMLRTPACDRHTPRARGGGPFFKTKPSSRRSGQRTPEFFSVFVNKHQLALTLYPLAIDMLYSKCSSIFCHATRLIGLRARRVRIARDHKHKQNIELMKHSYFSFLCSFIFFNRTANR